MTPEQSFGKTIVLIGVALIIIGSLFIFLPKITLFQTRIPGDIKIEKPGFTFYFPLGTSIILSALLTAIFWIIRKWGS